MPVRSSNNLFPLPPFHSVLQDKRWASKRSREKWPERKTFQTAAFSDDIDRRRSRDQSIIIIAESAQQIKKRGAKSNHSRLKKRCGCDFMERYFSALALFFLPRLSTRRSDFSTVADVAKADGVEVEREEILHWQID